MIDLGLISDRSKHKDLSCQSLAKEALVLVTHSSVNTINWKTLKQIGFIRHPDSAHHGSLLLSNNFAEFDHISQFETKGFSNQVSLILEPISRGIGFTILPIHAVNAFHRQSHIKIHQLTHPVNECLYLCKNRHIYNTQRSLYIQNEINEFLNS